MRQYADCWVWECVCFKRIIFEVSLCHFIFSLRHFFIWRHIRCWGDNAGRGQCVWLMYKWLSGFLLESNCILDKLYMIHHVAKYLHHFLVGKLKRGYTQSWEDLQEIQCYAWMTMSPLCNGSWTSIWETPSSLNGTPALSQGQEKETPVFLITSVEIPMQAWCSHATSTIAHAPRPYTKYFWQLLAFFHRRQKNSGAKWRWNGRDASTSTSWLSSNLRSEMHSMWSAWGFALSLTCYTAASKVFWREEANSSATRSTNY